MSKLITDDCVSSLVDKHVGKTDISGVGDGTITGAISSLNSMIKYTEIVTDLNEYSFVSLTEQFNFTPQNTFAVYIIDGIPNVNVEATLYTYNGMLYAKIQNREHTLDYAGYGIRLGIIYLEKK